VQVVICTAYTDYSRQTIIDRLDRAYRLCGHELYSTASIGMTTGEHGYDRPEDVLRDADAAMYRCKSAGTHHPVVFDRSMRATTLNRLQLEADLRRGIHERQFTVSRSWTCRPAGWTGSRRWSAGRTRPAG